MSERIKPFLIGALLLVLLVGMAGCVAGTGTYSEAKPANFWSGLFHGVISPLTLFITLFTGNIDMYEPDNVGWGYDCGFFFGMTIILGGGCSSRLKKSRLRKFEKKWDKFGDEIEREVKKEVLEALRSEAGDEGCDEDNWKEIGRKIEAKVKRKLKTWAEKE